MDGLPPRTATLVLCLPDGTLLGALPPLRVEFPYWQEVGPLVDAAREAHGLDVTVLRLLDAERDDGCASPTPARAGRRRTSRGPTRR